MLVLTDLWNEKLGYLAPSTPTKLFAIVSNCFTLQNVFLPGYDVCGWPHMCGQKYNNLYDVFSCLVWYKSCKILL